MSQKCLGQIKSRETPGASHKGSERTCGSECGSTMKADGDTVDEYDKCGLGRNEAGKNVASNACLLTAAGSRGV